MNKPRLVACALFCWMWLCVPVYGSEPTTNPVTIFMVGDSTMADKPLVPPNPERGWGQLLPLYFREGVRIENDAVNGRSSKSFRDEGRWKTVLDRIKAGDCVVIQFGHNDEKPSRMTRT